MCLEKALASTSTLSMHQRRTNGEHRISRQIELSLAEKKSTTFNKVELGLSFLEKETRLISDPKQRPRVRLYPSASGSCVVENLTYLEA